MPNPTPGPDRAGGAPNDRVTYTRLRDDSYGLRGPVNLLEQGASIDVHRRDGTVKQETVGERVHFYDDNQVAIHRIERSGMVADKVTYTRIDGDNWGVRGPAGQLEEGLMVEVQKRDGSTKTETVGAEVSNDGATAVHYLVRGR